MLVVPEDTITWIKIENHGDHCANAFINNIQSTNVIIVNLFCGGITQGELYREVLVNIS